MPVSYIFNLLQQQGALSRTWCSGPSTAWLEWPASCVIPSRGSQGPVQLSKANERLLVLVCWSRSCLSAFPGLQHLPFNTQAASHSFVVVRCMRMQLVPYLQHLPFNTQAASHSFVVVRCMRSLSSIHRAEV